MHTGMNLSLFYYDGFGFPFIDRMKGASPWMLEGGDIAAARFDDDDYPTHVPDGSTLVTSVGLDPLSLVPGAAYVLTYGGTASFELLGGRPTATSPGRIEFDWTGGGYVMPIKVSGLNSAAPLTAISVFRADQEALLHAGEVFNPAFLAKVGAFDTLRYMDWQWTNPDPPGRWADRTRLSRCTYNQRPVPIELIVRLANDTRTHPWVNVPVKADDDYVRQMMTMLRDGLHPSLSPHVEFSNEVWNWAFPAAWYAKEQAEAKWGVGTPWLRWYGYRAAQVAAVAREVFGSGSRPRFVISSQTAWLGLEQYVFDGIAAAGLDAASDLFDEYAVTGYVSFVVGNDADRAALLGWTDAGDVAPAVAALRDGAGLTSEQPANLAVNERWWQYHGAVAAKYGLTLVGYEGGVALGDIDLAPYGADAPRVEVCLVAVKQSDELGPFYDDMQSAFAGAGGALFCAYNDFGGAGRNFGHDRSAYEPDSAAWRSLVATDAAADRPSDAAPPVAMPRPPATPVPAPGPIPTPVAQKPMTPPVLFAGTPLVTSTPMVGRTFATVIPTIVEEDSHQAFDRATGIYTVPQDGLYEVDFAMRLADGSAPGTSLGVFVGAVNADVDPRGWTEITDHRTSAVYRRIMRCAVGDQLRAFYYLDAGAGTYWAVSLSIVCLR